MNRFNTFFIFGCCLLFLQPRYSASGAGGDGLAINVLFPEGLTQETLEEYARNAREKIVSLMLHDATMPNLKNANLQRLTLNNGVIENREFINVELGGSILCKLRFKNCKFKNVFINTYSGKNASKKNALMFDVHFDNCRIENLNCEGTQISGSSFKECVIKNLNLTGAAIKGLSLKNTILLGVTSDKNSLSNEVSYEGVIMQQRTIKEQNLEDKDIQAIETLFCEFSRFIDSPKFNENLVLPDEITKMIFHYATGIKPDFLNDVNQSDVNQNDVNQNDLKSNNFDPIVFLPLFSLLGLGTLGYLRVTNKHKPANKHKERFIRFKKKITPKKEKKPLKKIKDSPFACMANLRNRGLLHFPNHGKIQTKKCAV